MSRPTLHAVPKAKPAAKAAEPQEKLQDFRDELEVLLRQQLERHPEMDDVRLKLIELYFEQQRGKDFLRAAHTYRRRIEKLDTSREWRRVASMGRMLLPGEALFSGEGSDLIEFIGQAAQPGQTEAPKVRRFGDEDQYRPLFGELTRRYEIERKDPRFLAELETLLVGLPTRRPTPLIQARRLSHHIGGAQIHIKREDLAGANAHLTVAVCGQALLARRLGRKTLVVSTADGRRGLAAAAVAARLGLRTLVFMDAADAERAAANTLLMKLMGAELTPVKASRYRSCDVREAALEYWHANPEEAFLLTGLDAAPPPYPVMTQDFTAAIGRECRRQLAGAQPDLVVARGGNTADALGLFPAFLADRATRLVCVDARKEPELEAGESADPFAPPRVTLTSSQKKVAKQILDQLEYPSVTREHALFKASGRVEYVETSRSEARQALSDLARLEGVVPPIETAYALAFACDAARGMKHKQSVIVMMAEQVDKDIWDIKRLMESAR